MVSCTSDAATNRAIDAAFEEVPERPDRRRLEQLGEDRVELAEDEREAGDARRDVEALRHLVQPHRPGRELHPRLRLLQQVAVDAGGEADQERGAEQPAEHHRRPGVARRRDERVPELVEEPLKPPGQVHDSVPTLRSGRST